jgi:hypothetical protein
MAGRVLRSSVSNFFQQKRQKIIVLKYLWDFLLNKAGCDGDRASWRKENEITPEATSLLNIRQVERSVSIT